jgi:hypothetical protein
MAMILRLDELPGKGWSLGLDRTWRAGEWRGLPLETKDEYLERRVHEKESVTRAREAGGVVAYRIALLRNPLREIVTQVSPYVSTEDALASIEDSIESSRNKPSSQITLVHEERVHDQLPNDLSAVFLERDQMHNGEPCKVRTIIGTVGTVQYSVGCSEHGEGWDWPFVKSVAALQRDKIDKSLRRKR